MFLKANHQNVNVSFSLKLSSFCRTEDGMCRYFVQPMGEHTRPKGIHLLRIIGRPALRTPSTYSSLSRGLLLLLYQQEKFKFHAIFHCSQCDTSFSIDFEG